MKKLIVFTCALLLLFAGCAVQGDTDQWENSGGIQETDPGRYVPNSSLEQQTNGAVRVFDLENNYYTYFSRIGERLLLASDGEQTAVELFSGEKCVESAAIRLSGSLAEIDFQSIENGAVYFSPGQRQVVFLDKQLVETVRVQLPETAEGNPVVSRDGKQVYYCTDKQIYAVEVERNLTRLVKTHECIGIELLGDYLDSQVLCCKATYRLGDSAILYFSAETGQTLYTYDHIDELYSYGSVFFGRRTEGVVKQWFFGNASDQSIYRLNVDGELLPALELGGVIHSAKLEDGSLQLQFYDLLSGKITARIVLPGMDIPTAVVSDSKEQVVWLLSADAVSGVQRLLRWNLQSTQIQEDRIYTDTFYTAQKPDEDGLKVCSNRADKISKEHGIRLRIWENAVKYPGNYVLEPEYQTAVIDSCMDSLEAVLAEFPKKFVSGVISDKVRVCIVRSVDGERKSVQYWNGSSAYIILSVGGDIRNDFIRGLSYVVDSHVLGNSSRYDYWNEANPSGFSYVDIATHSMQYLEGEARAFFDAESMMSVTVDRSTIFYQAMLPDNAELFQSPALQKKLYMVCKGIRAAWNWKKKTEVFPWEQYLDKPIAYKK